MKSREMMKCYYLFRGNEGIYRFESLVRGCVHIRGNEDVLEKLYLLLLSYRFHKQRIFVFDII